MKSHTLSRTIVVLLSMVSIGLLGITMLGCDKESTGPGPAKKTPAKVEFVNATCPMMGSPINPDKVPAELVREFKGQKVAFCCGQCPAKWDKLTDAEKEAQLAKAKSAKGPSEGRLHAEDEGHEH